MFSTFLVSINNLSILQLEGVKAADLLQGQVSANLDLLNAEQALTAALCNLKGRVVTSLEIVFVSEQKLLLIIPSNNLETLKLSLEKLLPFYKCQLSSAEEKYQLVGMSGKDVPALASSILGAWPKQDYQQALIELGVIVRLPGPQARALIVLDKTHANSSACLEKLGNLTNPADADCWNLLDIKTGRAQVDASLSASYLPQMLNMQATGAVSFNKGCYLGQEIIARTQFRGQVKQRLYRAHLPASSLSLPAQVYDAAGKKQGNIIQIAADRRGELEVLAVIKDKAVTEDASLFADAELSKKLIILKLPYAPDSRLELHQKQQAD